MSLVIHGSLKPGLISAKNHYRIRGAVALKKAVVMLIEKITPITPFDTGELESSLIDEGVKSDIHGLVNRFGFNAVYAAIQHESLHFHHPGPDSKSPARGGRGQPKYVEGPMRNNRLEIYQVIARYLRQTTF